MKHRFQQIKTNQSTPISSLRNSALDRILADSVSSTCPIPLPRLAIKLLENDSEALKSLLQHHEREGAAPQKGFEHQGSSPRL